MKAPWPVLALALALLGGHAMAAEGDRRPRDGAPAPARSERRNGALHRALPDGAAWQAYRARFVTEAGRVVDTGNDGISHSEGQGYGMLLAVAAGDREAFDRIWGWTRANLMVRNDALLAWRWEPNRRPGVADMNNATDGDLLVAWALTEAHEAWGDTAYAVAGRRIAVEVGRKLILSGTRYGAVLLPGMSGFTAEDRRDGPVVNLSYLVFPAFARLSVVAPEFDWPALGRDGARLIAAARFGKAELPVEWTALGGAAPAPAAGFAPHYGYNAVRVPLYLAWAGLDELVRPPRRDAGSPGLAIVDVTTARSVGGSDEGGYGAIGALLACAYDHAAWPAQFRSVRIGENYYPVTLHMLALTAAAMRFPSCLRD